MIVVTIDGVNYETATDLLSDLFKVQSMTKIKCDVRPWSDSPEKGQPTILGLSCMWTGERIRNFSRNMHARVNKKYNENWNLDFKDRNGENMDTIFDHFKNVKLFVTQQGTNPYKNNEVWFKHFDNIRNTTLLPSEELSIFPTFYKKDYDLFWLHTGIVKMGVFQHGPYEQGRMPACIPFDQIRKDKSFKRRVHYFAVNRYKFVIQECFVPFTDDIIVVSSDHGSGLHDQFDYKEVDEIFVIVNRKVDLSDIKYQWDIKKLILRLKEQEEKEKSNK